MAKFKRTLKTWRDDYFRFWNKINNFKRIVIGILIAGTCFYFFNNKINQPVLNETIKADEQIEKLDIPNPIPSRDEDEKIPGLEISLESAKKSVPRSKKKLDEASKLKKQINSQNKTIAFIEFNRLIADCHLTVEKLDEYDHLKKVEKTTSRSRKYYAKEKKILVTKDCPLKIWVHKYELKGTFGQLYKFLKCVDKFKYPARILNIKLEEIKANQQYRSRNSPKNRKLSFTLELYYHAK